MITDYHGARLFLAPGKWFANRYGYKAAWIILHGTAGGTSAEAIANYLNGPTVESSVHYIVGTDGEIVQCVYEHDGAWGNGYVSGSSGNPGIPGDGIHHDAWWSPTLNPNFLTISIEHCKPATDNSSTLTSAQQAASFALIKDICLRQHIPMRAADSAGGITGHFSIDPINRARCPGPYPWSALWSYLQGASTVIDLHNPAVAAYFELVNPTTWRCKATGFIIRDGILNYYQTMGGIGLNGLTELGLPLSNEIPLTDASGKSIANSSQQLFERGIAVWNPAHDYDNPPQSAACYTKHVDPYYPLPQQIQTLTTQITDSTNSIATLTSQLAAAQTAGQTLQAQLTAANDQIAKLQADLSSAQSGQASAQTLDIAALTRQITAQIVADVRSQLGASS